MKNKKHFLRHQQDICELLKYIAKGRGDQGIDFFLLHQQILLKH